LRVQEFEQAGLKEFFLDGGAQNVFDQAVMCLGAGQIDLGDSS
jgi:hypothetical protein